MKAIASGASGNFSIWALLSEIVAAAPLSHEAKRAVRISAELKVTFTASMLWSKRYATLLEGVG